MVDLHKYLELERIEYTGRTETKRKELDDKIREIETAKGYRGLYQLGPRLHAIFRAWKAFSLDLIITRIGLRKRSAVNASELLSDLKLEDLQEELERGVQVRVQSLEDDLRTRSMASDSPPRVTKPMLQKAADEQVGLIRREIDKLRLERDLGMTTEPEGKVVLNIHNSTVNGLNLGSIVGDLNLTLTTLQHQGNTGLVAALKALSETIVSNEALGGQRRELLENLSVIGEQGNLPTDQRKMGLVKAAFQYIAQAATISSGIGTVWTTWGHQISAFFGLPQ